MQEQKIPFLKNNPYASALKGLKLEDFDSSKQAIMLSTKMS